jgi:glycosyltransferase involved in cell wall biosynthesis
MSIASHLSVPAGGLGLREALSIAVVIPCFRVRAQILPLLQRIGPEVCWIFVIDDVCPEGSGELVVAMCHDPRVTVVRHARNLGVGGAVMTGYRYALAAGADTIVKIDGDGQMDPALIPRVVEPLILGRADYVKGNRFFNIEDVRSMPPIRVFGNAALSFLTKMSSGYWTIFDPTNGYTAISANLASNLPTHKINARYFFESDMLFRVGTFQAVVCDLPMTAQYGNETSGLRVSRLLIPFLIGNILNCFKRIFYEYFLRGFSIASVELVVGACLLAFALIFGIDNWMKSVKSGLPATAGTVILSALPLLLRVQFILSFLAFDSAAEPRSPISGLLVRRTPEQLSEGVLDVAQCQPLD